MKKITIEIEDKVFNSLSLFMKMMSGSEEDEYMILMDGKDSIVIQKKKKGEKS